jgi:hypothetical protein
LPAETPASPRNLTAIPNLSEDFGSIWTSSGQATFIPASLVTRTSQSSKVFRRIPAMTDISTQPQTLSPPTALASVLRFPATFLKYLFRSRRRYPIDTCYANAHLLKDIGICRTHDFPPLPSHGRLW